MIICDQTKQKRIDQVDKIDKINTYKYDRNKERPIDRYCDIHLTHIRIDRLVDSIDKI